MQNLISLNLSAEDFAEVDAAIATLRRVFAGFVALQPEDRVEMKKMGPKSYAFCDQTLDLLMNNPQIVPPTSACPKRCRTGRCCRACVRACSNCGS